MDKFVLVLLFSDDGNYVLTLQNRAGPVPLQDKGSLPGGPVAFKDKTNAQAASRELQEKTGISIPPEHWLHVTQVKGLDYDIAIMATRSDQMHQVKVLKDEPVRIVQVEKALARADQSPQEFMPDFVRILRWGLMSLAIAAPEKVKKRVAL